MNKHPTNKKLLPKLRFPEFEWDGEWELINLEKLFDFKNGINASKEKYGTGIKFINVLDIIQNQYITYDNIIGAIEISEKEIAQNEVCFGDILFQRSSETQEDAGLANVYLDKEKSAVFGGFVIRGRKKVEYEPMFMKYLLKTDSVRKEITSKSAGSTRFNIGQDSLKEVVIPFSENSNEQQKIADCLSSLDEIIEASNEKLNLLKAHKKGLLQQLFPAEGEKVPKLRFSEFKTDGDWEETILEKVAELIDSLHETPKEYIGDGFAMVRVADIHENGFDIENCLRVSEKVYKHFTKRYKPKNGDLIFSRVGSCGNVILVNFNEEICLGQNTVLFIAEQSNEFLFYYLKSNCNYSVLTKQLVYRQ